QMMSVLSIAEGTSVITENLFENRMKAAPELVKMGADIKVEGVTATINGVEKLHGASVTAKDLRAGAALVAASLSAEGETEINGLSYID
ncbi:MAG: UDP-N-acetylglucosamine 1-carboxyvinyltransferase, partial [Bacillota bacterium]|nr:UDP-N-acetylglucosamine 1-carboxyvinyltransferase [Bacillota bacterium]